MDRSRLRQTGVGITVAGSLAIGLIGGFEGLRTHAYRDVIGVPTICFGETRGVAMGDVATVEQCKTMLGDALVEFEGGMRKCLTAPDRVPDKPYVAFLSLSYNIGVGAFCRSSVARFANAGNIRAACDAIAVFNRAGGRVVAGLTRRRQEERALCLQGA
jgi:lysozyme